jgi:hypothetical protein
MCKQSEYDDVQKHGQHCRLLRRLLRKYYQVILEESNFLTKSLENWSDGVLNAMHSLQPCNSSLSDVSVVKEVSLQTKF